MDIGIRGLQIYDETPSDISIITLPMEVLSMLPVYLSQTDRIEFALVCRRFREAESEAGERKFESIIALWGPPNDMAILLECEEEQKFSAIREIVNDDPQDIKNVAHYLHNGWTENLIIDGHFNESSRRTMAHIFNTVMFRKLEYCVIDPAEYDERMITEITKDRNLRHSTILFDICQQEGDIPTISRDFLSAIPTLDTFQLSWNCDNGVLKKMQRDTTVVDDSALTSMISSVQNLTLKFICANVSATALAEAYQIISTSNSNRQFIIFLEEIVYADFHIAIFGPLKMPIHAGCIYKTRKLKINYTPHFNYYSKQQYIELAIVSRRI